MCVSRIWKYLRSVLEEKGDSILVGIGGGECSGKTYLCDLLQRDAAYPVVCIELDGYLRFTRKQRWEIGDHESSLRRRSFRIGDHPECFDFERLKKDLGGLLQGGRLATPRRYDYELGEVVCDQLPIQIDKPTIMLVEGIFALHHSLLNLYHLTLFIDTETDVARQRYLRRHRGRIPGNEQENARIFDTCVLPAYRKYIEPTLKHADLVVRSGDASGPSVTHCGFHTSERPAGKYGTATPAVR